MGSRHAISLPQLPLPPPTPLLLLLLLLLLLKVLGITSNEQNMEFSPFENLFNNGKPRPP